METTVNFRELLKKNSLQVERPKSCPTCWLLGTIGQMGHEVTKGNGTNLLTFELLDIEPHPDIEEGILDNVNLKSLRSPYRKTLAADFWMTDGAVHHLTDFLDRVIGDPERPIEERLPETRGQRVMFKVNPHQQESNGVMVDTGQNSVDSRTITLAAAAAE